MRPRTVTVDGMDLHVRTAGQGPDLLLVHGLGGASTSWQATAERLADRFRVIAPDLPGFGRSPIPAADYTPGFFVDVLVGLLDRMGVEETHAIGSSMGGQVALELGLGHPERVNRLIAVAPAGVPPADFEGTEALAAYREITEAQTVGEVEAVLAAVQPEELEGPERGRDPEEILAYVRREGAGRAFEATLAASAEARRLGPHLDRLQRPTLIAWGRADPMIPWQVVRPVLAGARQPTVASFADTGHSPHNHRPNAFEGLVRAFVDERLAEADLGPIVDVRNRG
jgi:pimeloyl-ACP methyl ester carboxylesterase